MLKLMKKITLKDLAKNKELNVSLLPYLQQMGLSHQTFALCLLK